MYHSRLFSCLEKRASKNYNSHMNGDLLKNRVFPDYTRGEEIFNMVSHIVGAAMAVAILVICVAVSAAHKNTWAVVSSVIYGVSLIVMFTVTSVYHGLGKNAGKIIMRIIDHCDIYFTIAGTYTPVLLVSLRPEHTALAWTIFGIEWGTAILAAVLNAVDLERFEKLSFACYLVMGWCVVISVKRVIEVLGMKGFLWILLGGIAYSVGAVLYLIGRKERYAHSVFHIFVVIGALLQFFGILFYVI